MSAPTRPVGRPDTGPAGAHPAGPPVTRTRPRRWPWLVGVLTLVVLLAAGFVLAWFTPVLGVQSVQVDGITAATGGDAAADPIVVSGDPAAADTLRDAVLAAADVPTGTPLARVDLAAVADRVAALPEVVTADVERGWPDALIITVQLPVPVAVTQANGSWWLLDGTGEPFRTVAGPQLVPALPVVELATPGAQDPATLAAVQVASVLPPEIRAQLAAVSATTPYDVTLRLQDDRTVFWGTAGTGPARARGGAPGEPDSDTARKLQVLPAVLARPGTWYDISDPTLVSVR